MKKNFLTLLLLFATIIAYSQQIAKGYVYEDANNNGKKTVVKRAFRM